MLIFGEKNNFSFNYFTTLLPSFKAIPTILFIIFSEFLMVDQISLSPQKRSVTVTNKLVCTSRLRVAKQLRILGNLEISRKSQNFVELLPSAKSSSRNENFVSTNKNLLKYRN